MTRRQKVVAVLSVVWVLAGLSVFVVSGWLQDADAEYDQWMARYGSTSSTSYSGGSSYTSTTLSWEGEDGCRAHVIARNAEGQRAVDRFCDLVGGN